MGTMESVTVGRIYVGRVPPTRCLGLTSKCKSNVSVRQDEEHREQMSRPASDSVLSMMSRRITVGVGAPPPPFRQSKSIPKITVGRVPPVSLVNRGQATIGPSIEDSLSKNFALLSLDENVPTEPLSSLMSLNSRGSSKDSETLDLMTAASITVFHADKLLQSNAGSFSEDSGAPTKRMGSGDQGQLRTPQKQLSGSTEQNASEVAQELKSDDKDAEAAEPLPVVVPEESQEEVVEQKQEVPVQPKEEPKSTAYITGAAETVIIAEPAKQEHVAPVVEPEQIQTPVEKSLVEHIAEPPVEKSQQVQKIEEKLAEGVTETKETQGIAKTDKLKRLKRKLQAIIHMSHAKDELDKANTDLYGYGKLQSQSLSSDCSSTPRSGSNLSNKMKSKPSSDAMPRNVETSRTHSISRRANLRMQLIAEKYSRITEELEKLGPVVNPAPVVNQYAEYKCQAPKLCYRDGITAITRRNDLEYKADNFPALFKLYNKLQGSITQETL